MLNVSVRNGGESLPNGFDVAFSRGIPFPEDVLLEEVSALGKLHVCRGDWESGERADEHEVCLSVSGREFAEVLGRLAVSSAALFVECHHKPVDESDIDWDRLEYLKEFRVALEFCGLAWGDIDMDDCFDDYVEVMRRETRRLAQSGELSLVEPL